MTDPSTAMDDADDSSPRAFLNADQRNGGYYSGKISYTIDQAAKQIDRAGLSWSSTLGTGATVTYSFRGTAPTIMPDGTSGFSTFNAQQVAQAELALKSWADVANIKFVRVGSGYDNTGQITFANYSGGMSGASAFAYLPHSGTGVWVNNTASYESQPVYLGYGRQTLVHEIGHTLGLEHPGDYAAGSGSPTYVSSAPYYEDSRQYTVMSYWSETNTGADFQSYYASAPLLDDIAAIQRIYGANATTRTGDTVYGFNSNTGIDYYTATNASSPLIFAAWDAGGNDTFDFSGYGNSQTIDLRQGFFSSVGGLTGNVSVAMGAVIENAIGGSGADTIIGNAAANILIGGAGSDLLIGGGGADTFTGGGGNDTFYGSLAELSGDRITDFAHGDRVTITDYVASGGSYSFANGVLSIGGRSIALSGYTGPLVLIAGSAGQASFVATRTAADFSDDGHSDLLWRNVDGSVSTWNVSGTGSSVQQGTFNGRADSAWKVAETFDFDGDGRSDILWRNDNGTVAVWGSTGSGFSSSTYYRPQAVPTSWRIAGAGDLSGDGKDDVLWQNADGSISSWTSTGTGFAENSYFHGNPGNGWLVEGLGDFNGDGKADILWRNSDGGVAVWTNTGQGTSFNEGAFFQPGVPTSWHIDGIGDVNGDGRDDLIWRNDNGALSIWRANASGGFDQGAYNDTVATSWHIAEVGDFNGDGRADILWRNDNGAVSTWQSNGQGFDQSIYNSSAPTTWTVAGHDFVL